MFLPAAPTQQASGAPCCTGRDRSGVWNPHLETPAGKWEEECDLLLLPPKKEENKANGWKRTSQSRPVVRRRAADFIEMKLTDAISKRDTIYAWELFVLIDFSSVG